jgi:hypothetical protein
MRRLEELIDTNDPGWPIVEEWIAGARNPVRVLPGGGGEVLVKLQVTTRSPMGAIVHHSGGLVIDDWLRILGGGGPDMAGELASWNGVGVKPLFSMAGAFVVALDVLGGVFAVVEQTRQVSYFAPDSLRWEKLEMGYSDFVYRMMHVDLDEFFAGLRWPGWREEVAKITLDEGIQVMPPLWTRESKTEAQKRKPCPMKQLVAVGFEIARQLGE